MHTRKENVVIFRSKVAYISIHQYCQEVLVFVHCTAVECVEIDLIHDPWLKNSLWFGLKSPKRE